MKGYALHIGINYCNPRDLADCQLDGAIADAQALRHTTDALSFVRLNGDGLLLEEAATETGILDAIEAAAGTVRSGELLVVSFSGLGVTPDLTNGLETLLNRRGWVTHDGQVVDIAEILDALNVAPKGATVLVISACCFTGPLLGVRNARVSSARFTRSVRGGIQPIQARFAMRAKRTARAGQWAGAEVYHLAACGIDQTIDDGTALNRSPFVRTLIEVIGERAILPLNDLVTELANRIDPDPQLEKFPDDPVFDLVRPVLNSISAQRRTA
jgi:hypothetical protein